LGEGKEWEREGMGKKGDSWYGLAVHADRI